MLIPIMQKAPNDADFSRMPLTITDTETVATEKPLTIPIPINDTDTIPILLLSSNTVFKFYHYPITWWW